MTNQVTHRPTLTPVADSHAQEVAGGERFEFGENWSHFLTVLDEPRITAAELALQRMLGRTRLDGVSFLDVGSGSGLSSLAARRLGARVHSFDYDPRSVASTTELRRRFSADDLLWTVERGSALDPAYLRSLGQFDIVYSWGVLHHTGKMWEGLENAAEAVAPGGVLFVAIYNDTGSQSRRWHWIKHTYNRLPRAARAPFAILVTVPEEVKAIARHAIALNPGAYIRSWTQYNQRRGMSRWYDIIDWVGGYPYEYAKPEEIFDFYSARGFALTRMKCGGVGLGCNEFVFQRRV